jgi:hypothetical protein
MREQGGSFTLTSAALAGAQLGPGTALVDEDVLRVLLLDPPTAEKAIQIRYDAIVEVGLSGETVVVGCRDGRGLVVVTDDAASLRGRLLGACRALPEVTRALRALGSRRGARGTRRNPTDREGRFFAPLISARRASMEARDARDVISSFDAELLRAAMAATISAFAEEMGVGHPARRRAYEAELSDAAEDLSRSLATLHSLGESAVADVDDLVRWRAWAAGVQSAFEAADRAWLEIEPILSR